MNALATVTRAIAVAAIAAAFGGIAAPPAEAQPIPSPSPSPSGGIFDDLPSNTDVGLSIGDWITGQINGWFANLVAMAVKPLLNLLAASLLATPDVSASGRVFDLWKATAAISNSAFVLFGTVGAIMAMGHQTVQTRYAVKEVLPRLAFAVLATNGSFLICGKIIEIANALSQALLGQGFNARRAALSIKTLIILPREDNEIFYILLALVAVILLILLLMTFIMRAAMVLILVVAAPLALSCHALPQTDGLARFWWRAFTGLLLIQVAQSLTLMLAVRIFFNQDGRALLGIAPTGQLINLLLALCLLIILIRIPSWITRQIFTRGGRGSMITRVVKYAVAYKLTSPVLNALHLGRGGRSGGSGAARKATVRAITGKVVAGAVGGPAGTATATAITAASAARGGPGPMKHAPVVARRPTQAEDWEAAPVKHAPSAPAIQGKYKPTPRRQQPIPPTTPVYGHPRETFYANGPAGLNQLLAQRNQSQPPGNRVIVPPPAQKPVRPIVPTNAPIPGQVDWPENRGSRPIPPPQPPRRPRKPRGGNRT